jgi:hypothetical protein
MSVSLKTLNVQKKKKNIPPFHFRLIKETTICIGISISGSLKTLNVQKKKTRFYFRLICEACLPERSLLLSEKPDGSKKNADGEKLW